MWRAATLRAGGVVTEALSLEASTTTPELQILVVPGNPGLASFYRAFIEQLHAAFGGRARVWAVSHPGHDAAGLNGRRLFGLECQIQHKQHLLTEHVLAPGQPPAVILAHSIGSYIMLQAVKRLEEEAQQQQQQEQQQEQQRPPLLKLVLLMPFLATDWSSPRQRWLAKLAVAAPVLGAAAGAVGRLPVWLQDRLLRLLQPGAEDHAAAAMKQLMTRWGCSNNFHLATHEFRDLDAPVPWHLLRRLGSRVAVVAAPDDLWWPQHHHDAMQAAVPGLEEYFSPALSHAFCLEARQCHLVAQLVQRSVARACGQLAPASEAELAAAPDASVLLADEAEEGAGSGGAAAKAPHCGKVQPQLQQAACA